MMNAQDTNGHAFQPEPEAAGPAIAQWKGPVAGLDPDRLDLFNDQYGQGFGAVRDGDRRVTLRLRSDAFRNWLICHYLDRGQRFSQAQLRDQVAVLEALASRAVRELHNRSAWTDDRRSIVIDLADPAGRAVCVSAAGWEVTAAPPVHFRRLVHQDRLPDPERGGDLRELLDFLPPLRSDGDRLLVLAWMAAAPVPIPRPILMPIGEQGSGKTTLSRAIRRLVDPSRVELLGHDGRADLLLTFFQHAVPVFDNIDALTKAEADLFCRGVTGGAITRRRLFTDGDEYLLSFRRAIVLNGLHPPTNRADLLDRSLIIELDRLPPERRRALEGIEAAFEAARPRLFGGLLETLHRALERLPTVPDDNLSRMADFHRFGRAAAPALGATPEQFDAAIRAAEARQNRGASDNTLAAALLMFARQQHRWVGDAPALLERLIETAKAHQLGRSREFWPDTPIGLGRKIDLLRSALAEHGVALTRVRRARERLIQVEYDEAADADRQGDD